MIVQNNPTPWVVLTVLVMAGCAVTGMLLGNVGPFNSHITEANIPIQQTQGALNSFATQSAMELVQTQQAPMIQQTAVVAQMTTIPLQQTATQVAMFDAYQSAQANATQTMIAGDVENAHVMMLATQTSIANSQYIQNLTNNATATTIAQSQIQDQTTEFASFTIIGIAVLMVCGWIMTRAVTQITTARAREKVAQAQLLAEQRRLAILRASIQAQRGDHGHQFPVPKSLMKQAGDGKGLPRAE